MMTWDDADNVLLMYVHTHKSLNVHKLYPLATMASSHEATTAQWSHWVDVQRSSTSSEQY